MMVLEANAGLTPNIASQLAYVALQNIAQEYPNKLDHVLNGSEDLLSPSSLHPVFFGSFDWHSCVHMHWTLARLLRVNKDSVPNDTIINWFEQQFTNANMAQECAYLGQTLRQSFERTYGWAWLLKLQLELDLLAAEFAPAKAWCAALQPLTDAFIQRYLQFLPLAQFPIRAGTHANSAFGLLFALQYAKHAQHLALRRQLENKAHAWFGKDQRYPARFEPSGDDFLSAGLISAVLMREVLDGCDYADWWQQFSPQQDELAHWLTPVAVSDRTDPKMSHLDGLNLSRAWCWKTLLPQLPQHLQAPVSTAITAHLQESTPHALHGDYVGTHWLASFVLLAMTESSAPN